MIHRAKLICTAYCTWETNVRYFPHQLEWSGLENQKYTAPDNKATQLSHFWHTVTVNMVMASLAFAVPSMIVTVTPNHHWRRTPKTVVRWLLIWCHLVLGVPLVFSLCSPSSPIVQIARPDYSLQENSSCYCPQQGNTLYSSTCQHSTVKTALITCHLDVIWRHWLKFINSLWSFTLRICDADQTLKIVRRAFSQSSLNKTGDLKMTFRNITEHLLNWLPFLWVGRGLRNKWFAVLPVT